MKKRVLLVGPILTQSGYGEHARLIYRALKSREDLFDIFISPIGWGATSWLFDSTKEREDIDNLIIKTAQYMGQGLPFDTTIMVTIPTEWEQYRASQETIGVCAGIESDRVSPHWIDVSNKIIDKIIVPSCFSKEIFERSSWDVKDQHGNDHTITLQKPIEYINYPVKPEYVSPNKDLLSNIKFDHDFNFLCVAQWGPRKNIAKTIENFVEEFKEDDVGLVLKVFMRDTSTTDFSVTKKTIEDILNKYEDRECSVHLIHGYMKSEELASLMVHPQIKAMINFGHGEGYGLPLFEAAAVGLPVITHDWGGQKDFLYAPKKDKKGKEKLRPHFGKVAYDLKPIQKEAVWDGVLQPESQWAFPNNTSCKIAMRQCYEHYSLSVANAKRLKKWVGKNFTEEQIYKQICASISSPEDEEWQHTLNDIQLI
tara:strand:- start:25101 stop:26375 length:1275 start_codon:yes stop_codon:yes gene_type:complete